ncbi:hypothetical protein [Microcoleus sp. bin38.metabat.b11b12b14.051]|uniref:hypothetical protein n=1 Tax=Microcoleus sp. bin38.metabat.b11b12b14.051 TaxID=2742709 RepID=UPI0025D24131|nr:hypothetical protein [Microcoleus sp. bin38.metabat.b11b12b14.051]
MSNQIIRSRVRPGVRFNAADARTHYEPFFVILADFDRLSVGIKDGWLSPLLQNFWMFIAHQ